MADSLSTLRAKLTAYRTAELEILQHGQTVSLTDMGYTRPSLRLVQEGIKRLERRIAKMEGTRPTIKTINFSHLDDKDGST